MFTASQEQFLQLTAYYRSCVILKLFCLFHVLTLSSGQIFKPALYPKFLTLIYSLMCNPLQPAGIGGLLSCLPWHLHPYSPSCLCSRDKAVLCALAYTAVQLDIADCSVNIQTCNLLFPQYFKGNCN